jgi:hypothetical protein
MWSMTAAATFVTPGGGFQFDSGSDFPNAAIVTEAGSQIVATAENSYVALVAPVIVHGGSVSVNGSTAYIAGEELEFTVNQGLFDIVVTTGSDNPTPITHSAGASTGGPASTGGTDNHAIYMVAVPKNQAIQMLLEGSVGFQPAVSASVENGVIILSSGYGVSGTTIQDIAPSAQGRRRRHQWRRFHVGCGWARVEPNSGRQPRTMISPSPATSLSAADRSRPWGRSAASTRAWAARLPSPLPPRPSPTASAARRRWYADPGSSVTVTGDALVDASGLGVIDELGAVGNGTGGTARVTAVNGTIAFGGNLELRATGEGAAGAITPDQGGFGQGGNIRLTADTGSVTIAGNLLAEASGIGSASNGNLLRRDAGTGGDVLVLASKNGDVTVTGASQLTSQGVGGDVEDGTGTGGVGQGGSVDVEADNGDVDLGASSAFDTIGFGGAGPAGGVGSGGTVTVSTLAGGVALGATATFQALGIGGDGFVVPGGSGGAGTGGIVELRARGGSGASLIGGGDVNILTQGTGGNGGDSDGLVAAGGGRTVVAANAILVAETGDGSLQLGAVLVQANGDGGSGGFGSGAFQPGPAGAGFGGNVTVGTETGPAGRVSPPTRVSPASMPRHSALAAMARRAAPAPAARSTCSPPPAPGSTSPDLER